MNKDSNLMVLSSQLVGNFNKVQSSLPLVLEPIEKFRAGILESEDEEGEQATAAEASP